MHADGVAGALEGMRRTRRRAKCTGRRVAAANILIIAVLIAFCASAELMVRLEARKLVANSRDWLDGQLDLKARSCQRADIC